MTNQDFEDKLRDALRRRDPAPGFAERVIAGAPKLSFVVRLSWAIAAILLVGLFINREFQQRRAEEARRQAMLAQGNEKSMKISILLIAALAAMPLAAQLQLNSLDSLAAKAKESAEITLDAATLKMASGFLGNSKGKDKDDKAEKILSNLKSITVRAYEFAENGQYDPNSLRAIRDQLRGPGWSKTIDVKEEGESFELYSKVEQGKTVGVAMLAAEPKELAVIYIEGPLDLSELASLGGQFGIPKLPLPDQSKKGKE
jgi:hypothetical protein